MNNPDAFLVQLRELVGEYQVRGTTRLPSLRQIASRFLCSKQTAADGLRELQKEGLVRRIEPSGRFAVSSLRAAQSAKPCLPSRSGEILQAITRELDRKGDSPGQNVGSAREFQRRFGASHATVATALGELVRLGRLTRRGRSYCLPHEYAIPKSCTSNTRLVIAGHPKFRLLLERQMAGFFDRLRDRLVSAGWPEPLELFGEDPQNINWPQQHEIAGIVFVPAGGSARWQKYLGNLRKVPLAVVDYYLGDSPHFYRRLREVYRVTLGNRAAGALLGRHLSECGARRVAFFTHQPVISQWVGDRIEGLSTWFPEATDDKGMKIFGPGVADENRPGDLGKRILGLTGKVHFLAGREPGISADALRAKLEGPYSLANMVDLTALMRDRFHEALSHADIDAWVCVNDDLASLAQTFLSQNSSSRRILLAGFDNSHLAQQERITSVDLRPDFLADTALDAIFHRIPARLRKEAPLYPEPKLWVRRSSRTP